MMESRGKFLKGNHDRLMEWFFYRSTQTRSESETRL